MDKTYYVYIMTNNSKTIYVGVTNNLSRRVYDHRNKTIDGFTKKYNITKLVHFEETTDINSAVKREKQIKGWLREKKIELIESNNPNWNDLYDSLLTGSSPEELETLEILANPELIESLIRAEADIKAGRLHSHKDI